MPGGYVAVVSLSGAGAKIVTIKGGVVEWEDDAMASVGTLAEHQRKLPKHVRAL